MATTVTGTESKGRSAGLLDLLAAKFGDGRAVVTRGDGMREESKGESMKPDQKVSNDVMIGVRGQL